eukprot:44558-Amphidinium_carterae.1
MGGNKTQQKQRGRPQGGRERREAGQARTGAFESVEEPLPTSALDATKVVVRPDPEEEEDTEDEEQEEPQLRSQAEEAKQSGVEWKAPELSSSGENEEELLEIEAQIKAQLQELVRDTTMPLDEQKRHVRQLLAQWHPDKNRHCHAAATRIF